MANIAQLLTEHMGIWTAAESEKKSGRGRASGNAGTVYGVKKLRELILELAVRGKLIPQDTNDEPASELLNRIQAEKAKLVAESKIKKGKPLASITDDEKPFELPKGWEWARFESLVNNASVGLDRGKNQQGLDLKYAYFKMNNIKNEGGFDFSNLVRVNASADELDRFMLFDGDFLFNTRNSRELVGKTCVIRNSPEKEMIYNNNILRVQFSNLIEPEFIDNWFRSESGSENLDKLKSNTTNVCAIYQGNLFNYLCPVGPRAEQERIVTKVDKLMALCDQLEQQHSNALEAHENLVSQLLATLTQSQNAAEFNANWQRIYAHFDVLFTSEASIDALKQTLLQLAVMGKLVLQDPNDEPASALLKRIQAEKAKLITEGKLKKDKPLVPNGENEKPFELPKGWEWTTLLNAAVVNPRNNAPDDIEASFVPMTYIGSEFSDKHQDEKRLWKDIKQGFTHFSEGDIGVAKITPCFENSKACVFENLENGLGAGTTELHIVRPVMNTLSPRYVLAYLKSPRFLELGESKMTGTAGQKRLPKDFVETNPFPLPPLAEQHRIVAKVDALMALCDQLKSRIKQANQQQQTIADVLVAQTMA